MLIKKPPHLCIESKIDTSMTTYIKKSREKASGIAVTRPDAEFSDGKSTAKKQRQWDRLRAIGVMAIPGLGLLVSVLSNYLFFKELLMATAIIGMVMLLKVIRHPAIIIAREDRNRAFLN